MVQIMYKPNNSLEQHIKIISELDEDVSKVFFKIFGSNLYRLEFLNSKSADLLFEKDIENGAFELLRFMSFIDNIDYEIILSLPVSKYDEIVNGSYDKYWPKDFPTCSEMESKQ